MPDRLCIEYPSVGKTYSRNEYGVYSYGTYEASSVLAGQERRSALGSFDSLEEAQLAYPGAEWVDGSLYHEVTVSQSAPDWFDPEAAGEVWSEDY